MLNSKTPGTITAACGVPFSNIANFRAAARLTKSPPYLPCGPWTTQLPLLSLPIMHIERSDEWIALACPMTRTPQSDNAECADRRVVFRLGNDRKFIRAK